MITQALLRCWYLTKVETHDGTKYQLLTRIKSLRFHYSLCQKLKEEARVRFKINEIIFHCLDNLKIYKLFAT